MKIDNLLYDTKVKILKRQGNGISGRIYYEATSREPLTEADAAVLQSGLGYAPEGYGLSKFTQVVNFSSDKLFVYHWQSSTSCD